MEESLNTNEKNIWHFLKSFPPVCSFFFRNNVIFCLEIGNGGTKLLERLKFTCVTGDFVVGPSAEDGEKGFMEMERGWFRFIGSYRYVDYGGS